jgi:uroporphyrinogen-III synthase
LFFLKTGEETEFSRLLSEQGADALQCAMFTIRDTSDSTPVAERRVRRFIDKPAITSCW